MTGLILAIARAAGEVAPLMLVGVVKLAPTLPMDGNFPYLHVERKFMHLGFHIYDVGFQSPNVEAARPLVYATSFLLVTVIVGLNLTAADTVIHYDPWWNPAVENQATDRAHRLGQDKPVFVYKLIVSGSIEEKILALQERKAELAAGILSEDHSVEVKFGSDDIAALFAPLPE
jgi:hypothetical protein